MTSIQARKAGKPAKAKTPKPSKPSKPAPSKPKEDRRYTGQDIQVLEGLEPVRKRPGMYIGGVDERGYHHLLWEIVDNSVDEVINGYAKTIVVKLEADHKGVTVEDDGRGIPVDVIPKFGKNALELILCTLHAGGKFEQGNYIHSGGLHGVGSSVTNALSEQLVATVWREGKEHVQTFSRGKPTSRLKAGALPKARKTGTRVSFRPDPDVFGARAQFDAADIKQRLEAKTYLHAGLHVVFIDDKSDEKVEYTHEGGIKEYLQKIVVERDKASIQPTTFYLGKEQPRMELALLWTEATDEHIRSYVNGIPTGAGGTHELGLRAGLVKAVRNFVETHGLQPKGVSLTAEDIREGLTAILSIYITEPQFQGQTKDKLNNPEVQGEVDGAVRVALEQWLTENRSVAETIVARIILAARAREASRAASQAVTRKTAVSHRLNLPGKLADCASTSPDDSELFIVEGDSAGGTAKQSRDRRTQAILPLRGKVLNVEQASTEKVLQNAELNNIVTALGCGVGDEYDEDKLRYGKIFILTDADSDGHHISTLLLTFFYRHIQRLITNGHVYLALPPLYRIEIGKDVHWALDDAEKDAILRKAPKNTRPDVSRFKGLGEMPAEDLKATTLDPKRRAALRVTIDDALATDRVMNELMGKDPQARFRFIMDRAAEARDIDV